MKLPSPIHRSTCGRLAVEVGRDRTALGRAAARACARHLGEVIAVRGEVRVIFGGTPAHDDFFAALLDRRQTQCEVDWSKVTVFLPGEYVGIPATAPQSCRHYLHTHLLCHVKVRGFHRLEAEQPDLAGACARYAALLGATPIDFAGLDLGEHGRLAFNDPAVADFADPVTIKLVELDANFRRQQVREGRFARLEAVPRQALTLTLPVFRWARRLSVHAPGPHQARAVRAALHGAITTACPATMLRLHPDATLYLDRESAALAFPPR